MSATRLKTVKPTEASQDIAMQDASLDIWDKKYRLKDKQEQPVDKDINATYMRVAKALAGCLLYTSPSPRDRSLSRMPSSA